MGGFLMAALAACRHVVARAVPATKTTGLYGVLPQGAAARSSRRTRAESNSTHGAAAPSTPNSLPATTPHTKSSSNPSPRGDALWNLSRLQPEQGQQRSRTQHART